MRRASPSSVGRRPPPDTKEGAPIGSVAGRQSRCRCKHEACVFEQLHSISKEQDRAGEPPLHGGQGLDHQGLARVFIGRVWPGGVVHMCNSCHTPWNTSPRSIHSSISVRKNVVRPQNYLLEAKLVAHCGRLGEIGWCVAGYGWTRPMASYTEAYF